MIHDPAQALERVYPPDRFRLQRAWQRITRLPSDHPRRAVDEARWNATVLQSIDRRLQRESIELRFDFDPELPITAHRDEIARLLRERQVIVVCGETGSGKSTQLPKLCLEAGFGRRGMIGHTQPRRIAARSIAARLKEELSDSPTPLPTVGFKIRFNDATAPTTLVKLMTDGVLLAELSRDRFLDAYEVVIIDEAHERSLNIDLLMAHLHRLLPKRPELKLIITSATIDAERFAGHFTDATGPAPIVNVAGRTYPVDIRYLGNETLPGNQDDRLRHAVGLLMNEMRGDILIFFPTEREIRLAHKMIQGSLSSSGQGNHVEIVPLYSRLSEAEQQRIFQPHKKRRIVLATNVAESSLTVPGIFSVIDTGTARISRYAARSKVQRLPIEAVSQASANQRAGRCGRLGPGVCLRLYDETDFKARSPFTTPEIRRTDLASAILHAEMLKLGSLTELAFLDPPRPEMIRDGLATLQEIGAMQEDGTVTAVGRQLGRWPVSPRVGRMMIEAHRLDCLADVLIIASALEAQDVRLRPVDRQSEADAAHQKFVDSRSDFLAFLRIWDFYHRLKSDLGRSRLERACRENYLSLPRLHEWMDLYRQLRTLVEDAGWSVGPRRFDTSEDPTSRPAPLPKGYDDIHQCLLIGLLSGIAYLDDAKKYKGVGGIELQLWPGSGVKSRKPKWIVASEIVETHQRYARTVAAVEPEWIEQSAGHLLKRHYESPHFSRKSGSAMTYERATLFGLPIIARRPTALAPIDPQAARRLLIDEGLVERQLSTRAAFVQHNQQLLEEVQAWASKTRRRDLVVDPYFLQQFYDRTLPDEVVDRPSLEKFDRELSLRKNKPDGVATRPGESPYLTWEQLVASFDRHEAESAFPEQLVIGPTELPIEYRFAPGADDDGLTVSVPDRVVGQISDDKLAWLIPGLLEEKVAQLIKTLPKPLRRNLVPAPAMAAKAMPRLMALRDEEAPFWPSLCRVLGELGGERIQRSDFDPTKLDSHLHVRLAVKNDQGEIVQTSREIGAIKPPPVSTSTRHDASATPSLPAWFTEKWTEFKVDLLPKSLVVVHHGVRVERFVGLSDGGDHVRPTLFDYVEHAQAAMRGGLIRLFALADNRELRSHIQHLPGMNEAQVKLSDRISTSDLRDGIRDLMAAIAFLDKAGGPEALVWAKDDFNNRRVDRIRRISTAAAEVGAWLPKQSKIYHEMRLSLPKSGNAWKANLEDVHRQLAELFHHGFLSSTTWELLREYPRYLEAIKHRASRWGGAGLAADTAKMLELQKYERDFQQLVEARPNLAWRPESGGRPTERPQPLGSLADLRWMLEEYRVSLFAQQLGTKVPVSAKRLEKLRDSCT